MARGGRLIGAFRNELSMVQRDSDRDALLHSCDARYRKVIRQKKFGVVKTERLVVHFNLFDRDLIVVKIPCEVTRKGSRAGSVGMLIPPAIPSRFRRAVS